jgi:hypothetical protein
MFVRKRWERATSDGKKEERESAHRRSGRQRRLRILEKLDVLAGVSYRGKGEIKWRRSI